MVFSTYYFIQLSSSLSVFLRTFDRTVLRFMKIIADANKFSKWRASDTTTNNSLFFRHFIINQKTYPVIMSTFMQDKQEIITFMSQQTRHFSSAPMTDQSAKRFRPGHSNFLAGTGTALLQILNFWKTPHATLLSQTQNCPINRKQKKSYRLCNNYVGAHLITMPYTKRLQHGQATNRTMQ